MKKKQAIFLLVLASIGVILCVIGLYLTYRKDKQMREDKQSSTVEVLQSTIIDEEKKVSGDASGNSIVDGEEDAQYIIDDIGYDIYQQLIGAVNADEYYDTSEADKAIERYYRRQKVTPQPIPKSTTESEQNEKATTENNSTAKAD